MKYLWLVGMLSLIACQDDEKRVQEEIEQLNLFANDGFGVYRHDFSHVVPMYFDVFDLQSLAETRIRIGDLELKQDKVVSAVIGLSDDSRAEFRLGLTDSGVLIASADSFDYSGTSLGSSERRYGGANRTYDENSLYGMKISIVRSSVGRLVFSFFPLVNKSVAKVGLRFFNAAMPHAKGVQTTTEFPPPAGGLVLIGSAACAKVQIKTPKDSSYTRLFPNHFERSEGNIQLSEKADEVISLEYMNCLE